MKKVIFIVGGTILGFLIFLASLYGKPKDFYYIKGIEVQDLTVLDYGDSSVLRFNLIINKVFVSTEASPLLLFPDSREKGIEGIIESKSITPHFSLKSANESIILDSLVYFDTTNIANSCCGVSGLDYTINYTNLLDMLMDNEKKVRASKLNNVAIPFSLKIRTNESLYFGSKLLKKAI